MRLDVYIKEQLKRHAENFFLRMQHTNPFPFMAKDIVPNVKDSVFNTYISCLPKHIRNAILPLMADKRYIDILNMHSKSSLIVKTPDYTEPEKFIGVPIVFHFSALYPSWPQWDRKALLDPEHSKYSVIIEWMYKAKQINRDYQRCCMYIAEITEKANTVGQLRTMFPDYVYMLPEHQQQHISKMQKRSRLPKGSDLDYIKKYQQFVAEKIALCLLLPEGGEKIWIS